jgi:hypothetical protein
MTTTEASTAERLAALDRKRSASGAGTGRRPAEAARVLAAGAGTAAVLTMVTAMAQADQVVEVVESPVVEIGVAGVPSTVDPALTQPSSVAQPVPAQEPAVQTITVARPVRAQVSNARTSASR